MITHVVLFKLLDRTPKNLETARTKLASLAGQIPQLRHFEVGADLLHTDRSYDLALVARFDSLADLHNYQVHPLHQEVVTYIRPASESILAVDYSS